MSDEKVHSESSTALITSGNDEDTEDDYDYDTVFRPAQAAVSPTLSVEATAATAAVESVSLEPTPAVEATAAASPKSDASGGLQHVFRTMLSGLKLEACQFCSRLMWGGSYAFCTQCTFSCHLKCKQQALTQTTCTLSSHCSRDNASLQESKKATAFRDNLGTGRHTMLQRRFSKPTFCIVCRSSIGRTGWLCDVCCCVAHKNCSSLIPFPCVKTLTTWNHQHFWVEGNLHLATGYVAPKCIVCSHTCGSFTSLVDKHCVWCLQAVHTACASSCASTCNLGDLQDLIVDPTWVIRESQPDGTEKWVLKPLDQCQDTPTSSTTSESAPPTLISPLNSSGSPSIPQSSSKLPPGKTPKGPLIVLINQRSGCLQGRVVAGMLAQILSPFQVFNIDDSGPSVAFDFMVHNPHYRLLMGGGDGTCGWILGELCKRYVNTKPFVVPLPIGTGNDLSRVLGWGAGYTGDSLYNWLLNILQQSCPAMLDRWSVESSPELTPSPLHDATPHTVCTFQNYFSIGIDAAIALGAHNKRISNPDAFDSRLGNFFTYFVCGATAFFQKFGELDKRVSLSVDDTQIPLTGLQCLVVMNLPSYGAGTNAWGSNATDGMITPTVPAHDDVRNSTTSVTTSVSPPPTTSLPSPPISPSIPDTKESTPNPPATATTSSTPFIPRLQYCDDGLVEVVGMKDVMHLAGLQCHLVPGTRLAQGRCINLCIQESIPCQVDGEPFILDPGSIKIACSCQVGVLTRRRISPLRSSFSSIPSPDLPQLPLLTSQHKL
ncbi:Diacylglycerol kinase beta [Pelomyxa schiedti]|nr:Diacylglycerol kinase beta [Pelomyxa schiedti]